MRYIRFIKKNPIFLSHFSPVRIRHKAPVLTRFETDIVILDQRRVVLLVELEKPALKLMKKDGGMAAPLQHAFDQVRQWPRTDQA